MSRRIRIIALTAALTAAMGVTGCTAAEAVPAYQPLPTHGTPDYQLGGAYDPLPEVSIIGRDSTDRPARGAYNICYVNGFQTQPGDAAMWLESYPTAVLRDKLGKPVYDAGWPDEMLLDTRTAAARNIIAKVQAETISLCASAGFDAVEFDNLDSWTRSGNRLTRSGNLALAKLLVTAGHEQGLAVGQKNTPQLGLSGQQQTGFDFVIAEECVHYQECDAYTAAYGERVIDIEYTEELQQPWSEICELADRPSMTILRDLHLSTPADEGYVYEHC